MKSRTFHHRGWRDAAGGRIRFQGLATGTEFPALIDAIERVIAGRARPERGERGGAGQADRAH